MQSRQAILQCIAELKRDKPQNWERTAKALCDQLGDAEGLLQPRRNGAGLGHAAKDTRVGHHGAEPDMLDAIQGETCPHCLRPYDEPEQQTAQPQANPLAVLHVLIDGVASQKKCGGVQVGRQAVIVAWGSGLLPDITTLGKLADYCGCSIAAISESVKRLPAQVRAALPRLSRKSLSPENEDSDQSPANTGESDGNAELP